MVALLAALRCALIACAAVAAATAAAATVAPSATLVPRLETTEHARDAGTDDTTNACSTSLRCWLSLLEVYVPDQAIAIGAGVHVDVAHTTCRHAALAHVASTRSAHGIDVHVHGVSVHCDATVIALGLAAGATFELAPTSSMHVAVDLLPGDDGLASAINASACDATLKVARVAFTGDNWLERALNAAIELFRTRIEASLSAVACERFVTLVDTDANRLLHDVNARLRPYMPLSSPSSTAARRAENIFPATRRDDDDDDDDDRKPSDDDDGAHVDWRANPLAGVVDYVLNDLVGTDGPLGVNTAANYVTGGSGNVSYTATDARIGVGTRLLDAANVTLTLHGVEVSGLNTWSRFDVLVPSAVDAHTLVSHTATRVVAFAATLSVRVDALRGAPLPLVERARLSANLSDDRLAASLRLLVDPRRLAALHDAQLLDADCWLHAVDEAAVTELLFAMRVQRVHVAALDGGVEQDIDDALNNAFAMFVDSYRDAIPAFFNAFVAAPMRDYANAQAHAAVVAANNRTCAPPAPPVAGVDLPLTVGAALVAFACSVLNAVYVVYCNRQSRLNAYRLLVLNDDGSNSIGASDMEDFVPSDGDDSGGDGHDGDNDEGARGGDGGNGGADEEARNMTTTTTTASTTLPSLASMPLVTTRSGDGTLLANTTTTTPVRRRAPARQWTGPCSAQTLAPPATDTRVPLACRLLVPALLFATAATFAISNASLGTSVYVHISNAFATTDGSGTADSSTTGGAPRRLPSMGDFSMAHTVVQMWDAGLYTLAILVALLSGAWPYVKLAAMLACWYAPVCGSRRATALDVLDALGKWSLIDAYVLILMMVSFRLHVVAPPPPLLSRSPASMTTTAAAAALDVTVEPQIGFHLFVFATVASLALTHAMLAVDRWRRGAATVRNDRHRASPLLGAALLAALCAYAVGMALPVVRFEFRGAVAVVLEHLGQSAARTYTIAQLGDAVAAASFEPNAFGVRLLQALFFAMTVAAPAAHALSMSVAFALPWARRRVPYALLFATEVLGAWSALDVFVVATVAALFQLERFAQYVLDHRCDLVNGILRQYYDGALHHDALCFDVVASIQPGCWALLGASALSSACAVLLLRGFRRAHRASPTST